MRAAASYPDQLSPQDLVMHSDIEKTLQAITPKLYNAFQARFSGEFDIATIQLQLPCSPQYMAQQPLNTVWRFNFVELNFCCFRRLSGVRENYSMNILYARMAMRAETEPRNLFNENCYP